MAKRIQLKIDNPCHENWGKMTPVEKGRFCGSCQKQVVDFTRMSDMQVATFFKKPSTGSVCGRFMQDQLERDIEIPRKRIPWIKYFFQFALPAFLVSARASAQGNVKLLKGDTTVVCEKEPARMGGVRFQKLERYTAENKISGRVIESEGSPLIGASVVMKGAKIGAATDANGYFNMPIGDLNGTVILVASYIGYQSQEIKVDAKSKVTDIVMILESQIMGDVIIVGLTIPKRMPEIPLIGRLFTDTSVKYVKSYPNPVNAGAMLTVKCSKLKKDDYILELVNQLGQVVHQREIRLDAETKTMNLNVPLVKAGNYFIKMTSKSSGKVFTEKLVIR